MCSVTAGIIASSLLSIGTGYVNYQSQKEAIEAQAESQASMYKAQAEAAEHNAKMEAKKQEQIADAYGEKQRDIRRKQRLAEGALRANTGAAGLSMSGSALDIAASGEEAYEQDKITLLNNQRNDNYNSRVTQSNYEREGKNNRAAAQNVLNDADRQIGALKWGTILGTASSIAGNIMGANWGGSSGGNAGGSMTIGGNLYSGSPSSIGAKILGTNTASPWAQNIKGWR